jgi:hemolysin III
LLELRDPVASSTHFFTSFWAIFATLVLWRLTRGDWVRRLSVTVFGLSMVILYAASGLFHALNLPRPELRPYQMIDQSAIYILIAGTCTPIMTMLLTGSLRKWLLIGIWALAVAGVVCLWLLPKAPHAVMVGLYLGTGWFGISGIWHYHRAVGWRGTLWICSGALLYTLGAICELTKWPVIWPGVIQSHEVLHLADMGATFCFFVFVVRFALNHRSQPATPAASEPRRPVGALVVE